MSSTVAPGPAGLSPETGASALSAIRAAEQQSTPDWNQLTLVGFRFTFAVTALFSLLNLAPQLLWRIPLTYPLGQFWYQQIETHWMPLVRRVARGVLHTAPVRGNVDPTAPSINQLVSVVCIIALGLACAIVWSIADRRRREYYTIHEWLRVYLRYSLGIALMSYGIEKVLLNQFGSPPTPSLLMTPVGQLTPFWMLVVFTASAPIFQVFAGAVEIVAAAALMIRPAASVGALLALGATANVVVLNFAFHFGMYVLATALLVMAMILTAPVLPRLARVLLGQAVPAGTAHPLFSNRRLERASRAVSAIVLMATVAQEFRTNLKSGQYTRGRPALYGAYDVQAFGRGHVSSSTSVLDANQWRQLTIDPTPTPLQSASAIGRAIFVRDTVPVSVVVDTSTKILRLISQRQRRQQAQFLYSVLDSGRVQLSGIDGLHGPSRDSITITLRSRDLDSLPLLRRRRYFR